MAFEVKKCDNAEKWAATVVVNDSLETILLGLRTHTCKRTAWVALAEAKIQFCKGTENKRKEVHLSINDNTMH